MITFTAACLTFSGRREAANRHAFACCVSVKRRNEAGKGTSKHMASLNSVKQCIPCWKLPKAKSSVTKSKRNPDNGLLFLYQKKLHGHNDKRLKRYSYE